DYKSDEQNPVRKLQAAKVIQSVLAECEDSSRLLELFYLSREPGLLEILRAVAALPEETRASLEAFFTMSHEPASIKAGWDRSGRLTLASPQVGHAMAIMRFCAENEDGEATLLPN